MASLATTRACAFGLFGGRPSAIAPRSPDGTEIVAKSKQILRGIAPGTIHRQIAGGGGGYGDPFERPAALVADEVRNGIVCNGIVSPEAAERDYGVARRPWRSTATGRTCCERRETKCRTDPADRPGAA